jgi:N utilization substance protein B
MNSPADIDQPGAAAPTAPRAPAPRKAGDKSARTRAREFALQALYQHLVGHNPAEDIDSFTRDLIGFHKADAAHFDALLHGCIREGEQLDALITPHIDRKLTEVSPIEHGVLWIGAYELRHCMDVPWRVAINECIELAKGFGGTDGYKWVNGVLNQLAPQLRAQEVGRRP